MADEKPYFTIQGRSIHDEVTGETISTGTPIHSVLDLGNGTLLEIEVMNEATLQD
jgi:hypothetical protein